MRLSPLQAMVDGWVGGFAETATDWRSLASVAAGGVAYRVGRIGALGFGSGNVVRAFSIGLGLASEVSTFELTHRSLSETPNLWRWSGPGGLRQGFLQSFVTFGTLKGAGHLSQGQNLIARHLLQDTAMVAGHQISGALNLTPRPTGNLAEQYLHAEATNLQIGAGMALTHHFAPRIHALERGLDLSLRSANMGTGSIGPGEEISPLQGFAEPVLAGAPRLQKTSSSADPLDPKGFLVAMSEKPQEPKKRAWFLPKPVEAPNPWKEVPIRHLIEESGANQWEAARELVRRAYEEPRLFYQKSDVRRILETLMKNPPKEIADRLVNVLQAVANGSAGVFDREHMALINELIPLRGELKWVLEELRDTRPDLRPTLPPSHENGKVLRLPWVDPHDRIERRAKELFRAHVDRIRVSADSIDVLGNYRPERGLQSTLASGPSAKEDAPLPSILFTNRDWTKKIEMALAKSDQGGWNPRPRLVGVIQRYVDEPVQDFGVSSDSKYMRLRLLLGILEPRLKPALQALKAPWLIQAASSQYLALQDLGRLAEFDNREALLGLVDLANRGHASAEKALEQVEIKSLFRLGLKENDPSAVQDLARLAEKGSSDAVRHLFTLGRTALSANKEEAALEALQSFGRIYSEAKQDGPFYILVVHAQDLFEPLRERAGRGVLDEAWLDVLKSYTQFTHYGALDLLALSAARVPSARQRLLDLQKAIPKEKVPEVYEFKGVVEPAVFERMQFRMRRQKIRRLAIERLQGLLGIDR